MALKIIQCRKMIRCYLFSELSYCVVVKDLSANPDGDFYTNLKHA